MREILFRGKDRTGIINNNWVFGALDNTTEYPKIICTDRYGNTMYIDVAPETVGQYTGLTDKNGKKIFEGDIIKSDNGIARAISVVKYGEFEPKMFYYLLEKHYLGRIPKEKMVGLFAKTVYNNEEMLLSNCSKLIEVIGNVYDNPELLRGGGNG